MAKYSNTKKSEPGWTHWLEHRRMPFGHNYPSAIESQAFVKPARSLRLLRVARMAWSEYWATSQLTRTPELEAIEQTTNVSAFHQEGRTCGSLIPIYHFNALKLSHLLPAQGTLLDLGSGSGRFLAYLARCRPDLRIIGVDLSSEMVRLGRLELKSAGLADRVDLRAGDMTNFRGLAPAHVDAVSSLFSLHHLQNMDDLERCAGEIGRVRSQTGCGVWIFDHARPRLRRTAEEFPTLFTPEAPPSFQSSSRDSLLAAFSFEELRACLGRCLPERPASVCSKFLRLYQAHQLPRRKDAPAAISGADAWIGQPLSGVAVRNLRALQATFLGLRS